MKFEVKTFRWSIFQPISCESVKELSDDNTDDFQVRTRSATTWHMFFCFFLCAPNSILVQKTCCGFVGCSGFQLTRLTWLYLANGLCFLVHLTMTILTATACTGECTPEGMKVQLYRLRSNWTDSSASGFTLITVPTTTLRFDFLTAGFFGLSALFHLFPFLSLCNTKRLDFLYVTQIENVFCYWR
jgi:hypothetical protein